MVCCNGAHYYKFNDLYTLVPPVLKKLKIFKSIFLYEKRYNLLIYDYML